MKKKLALALGAVMLMLPQSAFAGPSSSTLGGGIIAWLNDIIDFLTGPFVIAVGTLAFLGALAKSYGSGGTESAKSTGFVGLMIAAAIGGPKIVLHFANAAGALV